MVAIVGLDSPDPRQLTGRAFAAILWSPLGPGVASGNLWINASGSAFRVAFVGRKVLSSTFGGKVDPIAFDLPVAAHLESAFVSDLASAQDGTLGPCTIAGAWAPGTTLRLRDDLMRRFVSAPKSAPLDAQALADPVTACKSPNAAARTIRAVPPEITAAIAERRITGIVDVFVRLGADSEILDARVGSTPDPLLNEPALAAARASIYRTEIRACRPIAAGYIFAVGFNAYRP